MVYQHDGSVRRYRHAVASCSTTICTQGWLWPPPAAYRGMHGCKSSRQQATTPLRANGADGGFGRIRGVDEREEQRLWEEHKGNHSRKRPSSRDGATADRRSSAGSRTDCRTCQEEKPEIEPPVMSLMTCSASRRKDALPRQGGKPRRRTASQAGAAASAVPVRYRHKQRRQPSKRNRQRIPHRNRSASRLSVENAAGADMNRRIADVGKSVKMKRAHGGRAAAQTRGDETRPFDGLLEPHHREIVRRVNTVGAGYQIGYLRDITSLRGDPFHRSIWEKEQRGKSRPIFPCATLTSGSIPTRPSITMKGRRNARR